MPTVSLSRQRHLAEFLWQVDENVAFSYGDEDALSFFVMKADAWQDMGKPAAITISVTPVDSLNG